MILWILLFLVIWTVGSIAYFVSRLGETGHGKDPWYVWAFGAPVLLIAVICGWFVSRSLRKHP
jgi:hypothetical protein